MKRRHVSEDSLGEPTSKAAKTQSSNLNGRSTAQHFRPDLFDRTTVVSFANSYAESEPYKHAVVHNLISDSLLRSVSNEILDNVHFTPKETDIYKIHQSGDLANLDGLPASALERLPSLLQLRDALYATEFRDWISQVSGAGPVSGLKTDMAVNVYLPGCHLLCHDDVIGSRRVSYILYLTDPDEPWQPSWGGALRLYPTKLERDPLTGKELKVPQPQWTKSIPPAWNQLSFFAVQPGESFHDVQEVLNSFRGKGKEAESNRVRMAISGWYHIPQQGEAGFVPGLEARLAEKSSLQQLQGKDDAFDLPRPEWKDISEEKDMEFGQDDLEYLLKFMNPQYLTPETVDQCQQMFEEDSSLRLADVLSNKFAENLRQELTIADGSSDSDWKQARPPYKHRYMYRHSAHNNKETHTSLHKQLVDEFLTSGPFTKWLRFVTGLEFSESNLLARRFRKGNDYTLATAHEDPNPQLEFCLNLTPTPGWDDEQHDFGGYELYMAGEEEDDEEEEHIVSNTGGGNRRAVRRDPAVYDAEQDDDGILFSNPASWNTLSVVLRDKGTLNFVKYVSDAAPGDRWDVVGTLKVVDEDEDEGTEEDELEDEDQDEDQDQDQDQERGGQEEDLDNLGDGQGVETGE